jgi:uncharacterized membrane protein AbrB (regulator of aidB expression)
VHALLFVVAFGLIVLALGINFGYLLNEYQLDSLHSMLPNALAVAVLVIMAVIFLTMAVEKTDENENTG